MNFGEFSRRQALGQIFFIVIIHQKANRTPVHAIDRQFGHHEAVHGLQHQTIAAQGHHHVSAFKWRVAIGFAQAF